MKFTYALWAPKGYLQIIESIAAIPAFPGRFIVVRVFLCLIINVFIARFGLSTAVCHDATATATVAAVG